MAQQWVLANQLPAFPHEYIDSDAVKDGLKCCICLQTMEDPVVLPCGHTLDLKCLQPKNHEGIVLTTCPLDRETVTHFTKATQLRQTIREIVQCQCPGCAAEMSVDELNHHMADECQHTPMKCQKTAEGFTCDQVVPRNQCDHHEHQECEMRDTTCQECQEHILHMETYFHNIQHVTIYSHDNLKVMDHSYAMILQKKLAKHRNFHVQTHLLEPVEKLVRIAQNEPTPLQYEVLLKQFTLMGECTVQLSPETKSIILEIIGQSIHHKSNEETKLALLLLGIGIQKRVLDASSIDENTLSYLNDTVMSSLLQNVNDNNTTHSSCYDACNTQDMRQYPFPVTPALSWQSPRTDMTGLMLCMVYELSLRNVNAPLYILQNMKVPEDNYPYRHFYYKILGYLAKHLGNHLDNGMSLVATITGTILPSMKCTDLHYGINILEGLVSSRPQDSSEKVLEFVPFMLENMCKTEPLIISTCKCLVTLICKSQSRKAIQDKLAMLGLCESLVFPVIRYTTLTQYWYCRLVRFLVLENNHENATRLGRAGVIPVLLSIGRTATDRRLLTECWKSYMNICRNESGSNRNCFQRSNFHMMVLSALTEFSQDIHIQVQGMNLIAFFSSLTPRLKNNFCHNGVFEVIIKTMNMYPRNMYIQASACRALQILSYENENHIIKYTQAGGYKAVAGTVELFHNDWSVMCPIITMMSHHIPGRYEWGNNVCKHLIKIMVRYQDIDNHVQLLCCRAIKNMANSNQNDSISLGNHGACSAILYLLTTISPNQDYLLVRTACMAVKTMACYLLNCSRLITLGACETIVSQIREKKYPFYEAIAALVQIAKEESCIPRLQGSGAYRMMVSNAEYCLEEITQMMIYSDLSKRHFVQDGLCSKFVRLLKDAFESIDETDDEDDDDDNSDEYATISQVLAMVALLASADQGKNLPYLFKNNGELYNLIRRHVLAHTCYQQHAICATLALIPGAPSPKTLVVDLKEAFQKEDDENNENYFQNNPWIMVALDKLSDRFCRGTKRRASGSSNNNNDLILRIKRNRTMTPPSTPGENGN